MAERLFFEDLEVGMEWTSPARTITEADVVTFASMTGDFNRLHIDRQFAESTPYGQRVAHGLLGLSWSAGLASRAPDVETLAFAAIRNWEFLRPLFFGDTVHVVMGVLETVSNGRRSGRVKWSLKLCNQRSEVTQQGVFETIVARRTLVPRPHGLRPRNGVANSPAQDLSHPSDIDLHD